VCSLEGLGALLLDYIHRDRLSCVITCRFLRLSNLSAIKHNTNINNVISYINYIHFFLYYFNLNYINALVWNWDMCCASKKVLTSVYEEFKGMAIKRARVLSSIPCTRKYTRKEKRGEGWCLFLY
jgi:hypothetical protein